jgi:hypothetical protein
MILISSINYHHCRATTSKELNNNDPTYRSVRSVAYNHHLLLSLSKCNMPFISSKVLEGTLQLLERYGGRCPLLPSLQRLPINVSFETPSIRTHRAFHVPPNDLFEILALVISLSNSSTDARTSAGVDWYA